MAFGLLGLGPSLESQCRVPINSLLTFLQTAPCLVQNSALNSSDLTEAVFHNSRSISAMEFPQLNCTLLDVLFRNGTQNGSATALSGGTANAVSDMALTVGKVDFFIQHYIFPFQFCLGVLGNSINLVVLLSSGMKNQANILLSAMACADLALLFFMLPNSLVSFPLFYRSIRFAYFYFLTKVHCIALANCFATAATFLVFAVSLERFIGVRHPMHTRFQLRDRRLLLLILSIYGLAFALSFYLHIEYQVNIRVQCGRVWANFQHVSQLKNSSPLLVTYVRLARYAQVAIGIVLPVIAVAVLNVSLVYFLRKRKLLLDSSCSGDKNGEQEFRYSDIGTFQRRERKVTATVIAIITCFTVTHLPTLGPVIWEHFLPKSKALITFSAVLNSILVTGKVLNFFLFCSSSAHFRRRTLLILNAQLFQRRTRKKYSSMALSNMTTQTTQANINNNNGGGSSSVHSSLHHGRPCSSRPSHSPSQSNNPPAYRLQKQSTLSLREALLRQSGAELDDLPALTIEAPMLGRPANGPQSARPVVFIS